MNDKIKYGPINDVRGRRIDNNEWAYGYYCGTVNDGKFALIGNPETNGSTGMHVDPATVGQFIGIRADDDTRIYEGDIVECTALITVKIVVIEDIRNIPVEVYAWPNMYRNGGLTVIGNVYDSPDFKVDDPNSPTGLKWEVCTVAPTTRDGHILENWRAGAYRLKEDYHKKEGGSSDKTQEHALEQGTTEKHALVEQDYCSDCNFETDSKECAECQKAMRREALGRVPWIAKDVPVGALVHKMGSDAGSDAKWVISGVFITLHGENSLRMVSNSLNSTIPLSRMADEEVWGWCWPHEQFDDVWKPCSKESQSTETEKE